VVGHGAWVAIFAFHSVQDLVSAAFFAQALVFGAFVVVMAEVLPCPLDESGFVDIIVAVVINAVTFFR
jgi:hypothetical protein